MSELKEKFCDYFWPVIPVLGIIFIVLYIWVVIKTILFVIRIFI